MRSPVLSKIAIVVLFLCVVPLGVAGQNLRVDSLLGRLDDLLDDREQFENRKRHTIDSVRAFRVQGVSAGEEYRINKQLVELYRSYSYDSAMHYVVCNRELADKLGDRRLAVESRIDYCNLLLKGGLFMEAIENLRTIRRADLPEDLVVEYYLCYEQVYHHLSRYTAGTAFEDEYRAMSMRYVDSLRGVVDEDSDDYFALSRIYVSNSDRRIARALLLNMLDRLEVGSHGYAIVAATLADCYEGSVDPADAYMRKKCLIASAISDVNSTVKEYVSLSSLAGLLYTEGDVERAYRYGTISMEDANFYNARLRRIEMSLIYPIIERAYKAELDEKNWRLKIFVIAVSLLAAAMLVLAVYVLRQTISLGRIRKALLEANHIKDEYLGRFLTMCSNYIDKMERYQRSLFNTLNAGKMDELRAMVRSSSVVDHEIREFYQNFDRVFLKIFPDFVSEFNRLLRPDEQIAVPKGELLVPELRIFALVRLGISDSSQIAKFLRYSANTVYTYRTKVKNKAIDRAGFEAAVMNINLY